MSTLKGIKNLVILTTNTLLHNTVTINKPEDYNLNKLVKNKQISLTDKIKLLSKDRHSMFWELLTTSKTEFLNNRAEFNIDIYKHIEHFDPSGTTEGCGCVACQMNHKIFLLKQKNQKMVLLRQALKHINNLIYSGNTTQDIINEINTESGFFSINNRWLNSYTYSAILRVGYDENFFRDPSKLHFKVSFADWYSTIFDKFKEIETQTSENLLLWSRKLNDLCRLCNIPMKEKNSEASISKRNHAQAVQFIQSLDLDEKKRLHYLYSLNPVKKLIPLLTPLNLPGYHSKKSITYLKSLKKAIKRIEKINLTGEYDEYFADLKKRYKEQHSRIVNSINNYFILKTLP